MNGTRFLPKNTLFILLLILTGCASEQVQHKGPRNPVQVINESISLCKNSKFNQGMDSLAQVATQEKANPAYWNAVGVCYSLSGDIQKANFYYEIGIESLAIYKGSDKLKIESALNNNIGLIHLQYNRYNDAYFYFKKAESLSTDLYIVQHNLAQLYLQFKLNDKSLAILNKLEIIRPGDSEILYSIALIYARQTEYEKALLTLSKIKSDLTSQANIAGVYAYSLMKTNQLTEALMMIEKRQSANDYDAQNKILELEISAKLALLEAKKK